MVYVRGCGQDVLKEDSRARGVTVHLRGEEDQQERDTLMVDIMGVGSGEGEGEGGKEGKGEGEGEEGGRERERERES